MRKIFRQTFPATGTRLIFTGITEEFETMGNLYSGREEKRQATRDKLDNLKIWEMSLSDEERDAIARSVKSIEKQLSTLAGN